ncbi:hypothetical protein [Paractinoplanes ovalisporus]|uniref:hypothetical protein n=1 Tax=Paractinoplanes ovalisporus TaxID=2810368 RepID=UPI003F68E938
MFPAALRRGDLAQLRTLHRICRVYAVLGLSVPVFGLATAASLGVLTDAWLLASIVLTAIAGVVLGFAILPAQRDALTASTAPRDPGASTPAGDPGASTPAGDPGASTPAGDPGASTLAREPAASTLAREPATAPASAPGTPGETAGKRLGMVSGIFNLLWAAVVVLMIVRPGSTTGA